MFKVINEKNYNTIYLYIRVNTDFECLQSATQKYIYGCI